MKRKIKNILLSLHKQRPLVFSLAVLVSAVMILGSTFSWFIGADSRSNTFQTKELTFRIELQEDFTSPPDGTTPGQPVTKVVNAKNTGDTPAFIRLLVLPEIVSEKGVALEAIPGKTFTYDNLDTTYWTDGGDGYYYYLGKLDPGDTTDQPLFTSVTLDSNLGPEYTGAAMKIEVKIEASDTVRANYRDGWWRNGDVPPADPNLIPIDNTLQGLAI